MPSEITNVALRNGYERRLPTKGLDFELISKVLMEASFSPVLYKIDMLQDTLKFKRILHYYVESGIPLAIGIRSHNETRHSIVCCGHGKVQMGLLEYRQYSITHEDNHIWVIDSSDLVSDYVIMDDGKSPYSIYKWDENIPPTIGGMTPEYLLVPLYKRMILEAADAYDICTSILSDAELGIQKAVRQLDVSSSYGTIANPVVIRLFLASARGLKKYRIEHFRQENSSLREIYMNTPFPRFVWVCEIYKKEDYPNDCIGELIIDATSSANAHSDASILISYPHLCLQKFPDESLQASKVNFQYFDDWEPFSGYRSNLHAPSKT